MKWCPPQQAQPQFPLPKPQFQQVLFQVKLELPQVYVVQQGPVGLVMMQLLLLQVRSIQRSQSTYPKDWVRVGDADVRL